MVFELIHPVPPSRMFSRNESRLFNWLLSMGNQSDLSIAKALHLFQGSRSALIYVAKGLEAKQAIRMVREPVNLG